jgi:hypothetical protein
MCALLFDADEELLFIDEKCHKTPYGKAALDFLCDAYGSDKCNPEGEGIIFSLFVLTAQRKAKNA